MKLKKYMGHLCTMVFEPMYQRVSRRIEVKGFLIPVMQNNQINHWIFCITEDREVMQKFLDGVVECEVGAIERMGIKTLQVDSSDLCPIGNQHRGEESFGHFEHQSMLKFENNFEEWLKM